MVRVILFSFILFSISTQILSQDTTYISEEIIKWQNSMEYSLEVVETMPEEFYDFSPTKDEMTFGQQLQHMAKNMTWLASLYLTEGLRMDEAEKFTKALDPKAIKALIKESYEFSLSVLQNVTPFILSSEKKFFAGPMTGRQIINLMHDHATHHRGQLVVYLRMKDLKPPRYRGW